MYELALTSVQSQKQEPITSVNIPDKGPKAIFCNTLLCRPKWTE